MVGWEGRGRCEGQGRGGGDMMVCGKFLRVFSSATFKSENVSKESSKKRRESLPEMISAGFKFES